MPDTAYELGRLAGAQEALAADLTSVKEDQSRIWRVLDECTKAVNRIEMRQIQSSEGLTRVEQTLKDSAARQDTTALVRRRPGLAGWVATPAAPWIVALVFVAVMFIVTVAAITGRSASSLTPALTTPGAK